MNITGHCHCGELVFTAKVLPEKVVICHCTDCQLLSASAFRTVVMSEVDGMNFIKGTPKEYIKLPKVAINEPKVFVSNVALQCTPLPLVISRGCMEFV